MIENNIRQVYIPDDIYWEVIFPEKYKEWNLLVMFPEELKNEKILQDNIQKMTSIVREYMEELKLSKVCFDRIDGFHFDSQKELMAREASDHKRKADTLLDKMNQGISPYFWNCENGFSGYINNIPIPANCKYVVHLCKKS